MFDFEILVDVFTWRAQKGAWKEKASLQCAVPFPERGFAYVMVLFRISFFFFFFFLRALIFLFTLTLPPMFTPLSPPDQIVDVARFSSTPPFALVSLVGGGPQFS